MLLSGCTKGKIYALKNTEIAFNEMSGIIDAGANQQTEIEIEAKEAANKKETFESIVSEYIGHSKEEIHKWCLDGKSFSAEEAVKIGLIDKVLE